MTIDWKGVIKQFPKAFRKLCEWRMGIADYESKGFSVKTDFRFNFMGPEAYHVEDGRLGRLVENADQLYSFFDELGLFIKITPSYQIPCEFIGGVITNKVIHTLNVEGNSRELARYTTRTAIQQDAFFHAFNLLEQQCKN